MPDDFVQTMPDPVWLKPDLGRVVRRKRPKSPIKAIKDPVTKAVEYEVRDPKTAFELNDRQVWRLAELAARAGRSPADLCLGVFGFVPDEHGRRFIAERVAARPEWAAHLVIARVGWAAWIAKRAEIRATLPDGVARAELANEMTAAFFTNAHAPVANT